MDAAEKNFEGETELQPVTDHLGYLLRRAQLIAFQDFQETTIEFGLTPAEYSALSLLKQSPRMRHNQLTEMLAMKTANCVSLINKLENAGMVLREKLPISGRAVALSLTTAGEQLLHRMNPVMEEHLARMQRRLSADETAQLTGLLKRLIKAS